jgi:hypothetical protein
MRCGWNDGFAERARERRNHYVRVRNRQRHRPANLDDVVMRAVRAREHAEIAHAVHHRGGLAGGGLQRQPIAHEFDADEQSRPSHVANQFVSLLKPSQRRQKMLPDSERMRLQPFVDRGAERSERGGA